LEACSSLSPLPQLLNKIFVYDLEFSELAGDYTLSEFGLAICDGFVSGVSPVR